MTLFHQKVDFSVIKTSDLVAKPCLLITLIDYQDFFDTSQSRLLKLKHTYLNSVRVISGVVIEHDFVHNQFVKLNVVLTLVSTWCMQFMPYAEKNFQVVISCSTQGLGLATFWGEEFRLQIPGNPGQRLGSLHNPHRWSFFLSLVGKLCATYSARKAESNRSKVWRICKDHSPLLVSSPYTTAGCAILLSNFRKRVFLLFVLDGDGCLNFLCQNTNLITFLRPRLRPIRNWRVTVLLTLGLTSSGSFLDSI